MHERTPERLRRFAETHRQVGAICNAATWLEYQLEMAYSELTGSEHLDETQGERWSALVRRIKSVLREGVVQNQDVVDGLRLLLSQISATLSQRDQVAHSTWMITNSTPPGHVTGQRWRGRGQEFRHWHPDELEQVREDLERLESKLSSAAWNAVRPPEEWI